MGSDVSWLPVAALGATLLMVAAATTVEWRPAARAAARARQVPDLTPHGPRFARVPAPPPGATGPPDDLDREVARLAARGPAYREPLRERYARADDLYRFMQEVLPAAEAGERVSQFVLYLTLGQCQMYLRLDAAEAEAVAERMMLLLNDRPVEERLQWQNDQRRCRGFAGGDLGPLRAAMGADLPGSENEYASIWFQRAAEAGYPPALAEGALRISTLSMAERVAMLEEATASGDPDVYWMLSYHSSGAAAAAWLLLACRAGHDCSRHAEWFRLSACLQEGEDCALGESALEHFWYRLPAHEREGAWHLAGRIEQDRRAGRLANLPWPPLGRRNLVDPGAAEGLDPLG